VGNEVGTVVAEIHRSLLEGTPRRGHRLRVAEPARVLILPSASPRRNRKLQHYLALLGLLFLIYQAWTYAA
jgi:hypothetical protein